MSATALEDAWVRYVGAAGFDPSSPDLKPMRISFFAGALGALAPILESIVGQTDSRRLQQTIAGLNAEISAFNQSMKVRLQ